MYKNVTAYIGLLFVNSQIKQKFTGRGKLFVIFCGEKFKLFMEKLNICAISKSRSKLWYYCNYNKMHKL